MALSAERASWEKFSADLYFSLEITETQLGECESPRVLSVLSALLDRAVARNERRSAASKQIRSPQKASAFHGLCAPGISIHSYIQRIFKYANCSPACFVVAYAYIDRFMHQQPGIPITSLNVHRLLITSVMAAAKFFDDAHYNNAYYAKVGGVTTLEMNSLELEFLFKLDFRLHVTVSSFESCCSRLEREVSQVVVSSRVERSLHLPLVCGFGDGASQERPQKQSLPAPCASTAV